MQPFTILNRITKADYVNLVLRKSYKHPLTIIMTTIGIGMLIFAILGSLGVIQASDNLIFQFAFGLMVLILPFITKMQATKNYNGLPRLHEGVQYTFSDNEINCQGNNFSSTFSWNSIIKAEEISKFLLLFTGKNVAEILNKDAFTNEQLSFIKAKVYGKMI